MSNVTEVQTLRVRAMATAIETLEEAAKICDRRATATLGQDATQHTHAKRTEARNCGFAIRALAAKEES